MEKNATLKWSEIKELEEKQRGSTEIILNDPGMTNAMMTKIVEDMSFCEKYHILDKLNTKTKGMFLESMIKLAKDLVEEDIIKRCLEVELEISEECERKLSKHFNYEIRTVQAKRCKNSRILEEQLEYELETGSGNIVTILLKNENLILSHEKEIELSQNNDRKIREAMAKRTSDEKILTQMEKNELQSEEPDGLVLDAIYGNSTVTGWTLTEDRESKLLNLCHEYSFRNIENLLVSQTTNSQTLLRLLRQYDTNVPTLRMSDEKISDDKYYKIVEKSCETIFSHEKSAQLKIEDLVNVYKERALGKRKKRILLEEIISRELLGKMDAEQIPEVTKKILMLWEIS